jgi:hypothetical protein
MNFSDGAIFKKKFHQPDISCRMTEECHAGNVKAGSEKEGRVCKGRTRVIPAPIRTRATGPFT